MSVALTLGLDPAAVLAWPLPLFQAVVDEMEAQAFRMRTRKGGRHG